MRAEITGHSHTSPFLDLRADTMSIDYLCYLIVTMILAKLYSSEIYPRLKCVSKLFFIQEECKLGEVSKATMISIGKVVRFLIYCSVKNEVRSRVINVFGRSHNKCCDRCKIQPDSAQIGSGTSTGALRLILLVVF